MQNDFNLAALGLCKKAKPENKMYYVNRKRYGFSIPKVDANGKKIQRTNLATGLPIQNGMGEPEFIEETILFKTWKARFTELGYWSIYEVSADTPKHIAEAIAENAKAKNSEILDEEAFILKTNPILLDQVKEADKASKELERLKRELDEKERKISRADEEIARLKQRAGIK